MTAPVSLPPASLRSRPQLPGSRHGELPPSPVPPQLRAHLASRCETGRVRAHNEDAVLITPFALAVADGMGGFNAGEHASATALAALAEVLAQRQAGRTDPASALRTAIEIANAEIIDLALRRPESIGMATTLAVCIVEGPWLWHAHVGDSRIYLLRDGTLTQLTRDHLCWMSAAPAASGRPGEAFAAAEEGICLPPAPGGPAGVGLLARVVGIDAAVEPDIGAIRLEPGDRLLLCTDGLSDLLDAAMLAQALDPATETVDSAASRLLALALAGGGHDNIALIVADPEAGSDDDAAGVRRS